MRMNLNCIRDVLLTVETCKMNHAMSLKELCECLPGYGDDEVEYTCLKLEEAGYLSIVTVRTLSRPLPVVIRVEDITYFGHEFLDTVRPKSVWDKTIAAVGKVGGASLPVVLEAAKKIAVSLIISQL